MEIVITLIVGLLTGILISLSFGKVVVKMSQSLLHANGLGASAIILGGSLPDFLFAGVGLILADFIFSMDAGFIISLNFLAAATLGGLGVFNIISRANTTKPFSTSTGSVETIGSGFGVGLFNTQHAMLWVLISIFYREIGFLKFTGTQQLIWLFACWLGVIAGYRVFSILLEGKSVGNAAKMAFLSSRLYGVILVILAIVLGLRVMN